MEQFIMKGGKPLHGEVIIGGAKNAALGIIAGALLTDDDVTIENLPDVRDINVMLEALKEIGARVNRTDRHTVIINALDVHNVSIDDEYIRKIRASYYFIGALLGKYEKACVPLPGGCAIGSRPIDQHIKGFRALGTEVQIRNGYVHADAVNGLHASHIYLDVVSVGATINIMLAAVLAEGRTIIENVAKEPHVVDVANFLNSMGANIKGAGTDTIRIRGVEKLRGGTYTVIPDQIETGTLMIAAAATRGDVSIRGTIPTHMEALTAKLLEMGVGVTSMDDVIHVKVKRGHRAIRLSTQEYPGFPTDLQQPMSALLTRANGHSEVNENIYDNRFKHLDEMRRMGAQVTISGRTAYIEGVPQLRGAPVIATDLRGGAALVIAGLMADGVTEIYNPAFIARGYEHLEQKLSALGAQVRREDAE